MNEPQIALGTAQLGLSDYGIANVKGKPDLAQAERIIERAWDCGVRWFDTAQAYGNSESVLGHCLALKGWINDANVVSKLHPDIDISVREDIRRRVRDSLKRLQVPSLAGFLLHREELLDAWSGVLGDSLLELKSEGLIKSLGASVYHPDRAVQALETRGIDMIQVPANVFDRRMIRAGVFRLAAEKHKRVFVRSVYLQGLVLMALSDLPERMSFARNALAAFTSYCRDNAISRKQFAVAYTRHIAPEGIAVLGAETPEQVEENCFLTRTSVREEHLILWDSCWPQDIEKLVNPSQWPADAIKDDM